MCLLQFVCCEWKIAGRMASRLGEQEIAKLISGMISSDVAIIKSCKGSH
jgi:hypothetical protein